MKINKFNPLNYNISASQNKEVKKLPQIEKKVDAQSQYALEMYGRAAVSFGSKQNSTSDKPKELSDEDFFKLKEQTELKLESIDNGLAKIGNPDLFTPQNIFIADRLLSDETLFNNGSVIEAFNSIVYNITTPENAETVSAFIDKLTTDPNFKDNSFIKEYLGDILTDVSNESSYEKQFEMLDYMAKKGKVEDSCDGIPLFLIMGLSVSNDYNLQFAKNFVNNFTTESLPVSFEILAETTKNIDSELKRTFVENFFSDERLYNNESFAELLPDITENIETEENLHAKYTVIDKIINNDVLSSDDNIMKSLGNIIDSTETKENAQTKSYILDRFLNDEKLNSNPEICKIIPSILCTSKKQEDAELKLDFAVKFLNNDKILSNKTLLKNFPNIVSGISSIEQFEIKSGVLDKYSQNDKINTNETIQNCFYTVINKISTKEQVDAFSVIADNLFGDEKYLKNKAISDYSLDLIYASNTPEKAKNFVNIADSIINNPILASDEDKTASLLFSAAKTKFMGHLKMINTVAGNKDISSNENFVRRIYSLTESTKNEEQAEAQNKLLNKIVSEENLYNKIPFTDQLYHVLYSVNNNDEAEAKIKAIDILKYGNFFDKNTDYCYRTSSIINSISSDNNIEGQLMMLEKYVNDETFFNDQRFNNINFDSLLKSIKSKEGAEAKIKFLDKLYSDEHLSGNFDSSYSVLHTINLINSIENADGKIALINNLLNNETTKDSNLILNRMNELIYSCSSVEEAELKTKFITDTFNGDDDNGDYTEIKYAAFYMAKNIKNKEQFELASELINNPEIRNNPRILRRLSSVTAETNTKEKIELARTALNNPDIISRQNNIIRLGETISVCNTPEQIKICEKFLTEKILYTNDEVVTCMKNIIDSVKDENGYDLVMSVLNDERHLKNKNLIVSLSNFAETVRTPQQMKLANQILENYDITENCEHSYKLANIIKVSDSPFKYEITQRYLNTPAFYKKNYISENIANLINCADNSKNTKLINSILDNERIEKDNLFWTKSNGLKNVLDNNELREIFIKELSHGKLNPGQILFKLNNPEIDIEKIKDINNKIGIENTLAFTEKETITATNYIDYFQKSDINELSHNAKRDLLTKLIAGNADIFGIADDIKKYFPILPSNMEEYCDILPAIVHSLGIETSVLTENEINRFFDDVNTFSSSISKLSDEEYSKLEFTQEYDKDSFIIDVNDKIKNLSENEKQKVFDYFGFELKPNERSKTGYEIIGCPLNLNNGEKLATITNKETQEVVENLRDNVVKFSENNRVSSGNPEIDAELNEIINKLPELRPLIGKVQAGMNGIPGSHEFDVFKHSIKVMQKIKQNPEFEKLNDSDKKIMLLAAMLHDITKKEGYTDKTHAAFGSFDSFFISKKFNLTKDEEIKLYTLIKNHEWLGTVNTAKTFETLDSALKSAAYDLRHDNILDMTLMFTHADLKAVKHDDSFHDKTEGPSRSNFKGEVRSFGEAADFYAEKIRTLIEELKPSQPLLPVTQIPHASTTEKAITEVHEDGSTNIKGVYKDKDGLIIIKFNEVENEDWEKIGFPKGSISKGIEGVTEKGDEFNTGNIKFIVHGLDYANQLAKFDAFSLIDSDALLSVSYTERPESKYRFFRPQGVILNTDTKYIHGGGNTDAGSGCGKSVDVFKKNYIFGGTRESDRTYISNLIKEALEINDEDYIEFVKVNENKSFDEIEPEEAGNKIIKKFASINSNVRKGERSYNEMYVSNPEPMGVFAYNTTIGEKIDNPVDFLHGEAEKRTLFLRKYAIKNDMPFILFGD